MSDYPYILTFVGYNAVLELPPNSDEYLYKWAIEGRLVEQYRKEYIDSPYTLTFAGYSAESELPPETEEYLYMWSDDNKLIVRYKKEYNNTKAHGI